MERAASEELEYELQGQRLRAQVPLSATPPREDHDDEDEDLAEMAQQVSSLMKTSENQDGGYAPMYTQEELTEQNYDPHAEFQGTDSASEGLSNNNNEHAYKREKALNADQMYLMQDVGKPVEKVGEQVNINTNTNINSRRHKSSAQNLETQSQASKNGQHAPAERQESNPSFGNSTSSISRTTKSSRMAKADRRVLKLGHKIDSENNH